MIPKSITVGAGTYTVHHQHSGRKRMLGWIDYTPRDIYVYKYCNDKPVPDAKQRVTFWHEVTHAVLYEMGHPLWRNEKFVTEFSTLLSKAIDSAKL